MIAKPLVLLVLIRSQTDESPAEDECASSRQRDDFFRFRKFVLGNLGRLNQMQGSNRILLE